MPCSLAGLERLGAAERADARRAIRRVVDAARLGPLHVGVTLVDDDEMRALNGRWRGKDAPTDVLSFAAHEGDAVAGVDDELGDLVISIDTARRQARALGHRLDVELAVLVAHGLLHLCGLDHARGDDDARVQAECEATLLDAAGYDVRAGLVGRALVGRVLVGRVRVGRVQVGRVSAS